MTEKRRSDVTKLSELRSSVNVVFSTLELHLTGPSPETKDGDPFSVVRSRDGLTQERGILPNLFPYKLSRGDSSMVGDKCSNT